MRTGREEEMKTCTRTLKDGTQEVIRLLSPDELERCSKDDPLFFEKSIVWLQEVDRFAYVRVQLVHNAMSRRGPIYLGTGAHLIGYSKLTPNAPRHPTTRGYVRRVFYLKDKDLAADASAPPGAVDPRTVLPGVAGAPCITEKRPCA